MRQINYNLIPEHCRGGMRRYIEKGILPGSFLQAVICNNLVKAVGRADDINKHNLFNYAEFLYNCIPTEAWGSEEKMYKWAEKKLKETWE